MTQLSWNKSLRQLRQRRIIEIPNFCGPFENNIEITQKWLGLGKKSEQKNASMSSIYLKNLPLKQK